MKDRTFFANQPRLSQSDLEYHYDTIGRVIFFLAEHGLSRVDLDQSNAAEILDHRNGDDEYAQRVFCDVLHWMIGEGVIRTTHGVQEYDGGYAFNGVQLTSKGLLLIKQKANFPCLTGSIEENLKGRRSDQGNGSSYGKWGEFVGGLLGSLTKSVGGG